MVKGKRLSNKNNKIENWQVQISDRATHEIRNLD